MDTTLHSVGQFALEVGSLIQKGGTVVLQVSSYVVPRVERPLYFATQLFKVMERKEWIGVILPYRVMALRFMTLNSIYTGDMKERFSFSLQRDFWTGTSAKAMGNRAEFVEGVVWTGNFVIRLLKESYTTASITYLLKKLGCGEEQQVLVRRGIKVLDSVTDGPLEALEKVSVILEFVAAAQAWYCLSAQASPSQKTNTRLKFAYTSSRVGGYAVGFVFGAKAALAVGGASLLLNLARDYARWATKPTPDPTPVVNCWA